MKYLFYVLVGGLITLGIANAGNSIVGPECITKPALEKLMEDKKFETLIQTVTDNGKINETLFTPLYDFETIIVEYQNPNPKLYCIISKTHKTKMNDHAIDLLHEKLEKMRGARA